MKFPGKVTFYRNKNAMAFGLIGPRWEEFGDKGHERVSKNGGILVSVAPAQGKQSYDWESKIDFALNPNEMGEVVYALRKGVEYRTVHDPAAGTDNAGKIQKWFDMRPQEKDGKKTGAFFIQLGSKENGETSKETLVIGGGEQAQLSALLNASIPVVYGW